MRRSTERKITRAIGVFFKILGYILIGGTGFFAGQTVGMETHSPTLAGLTTGAIIYFLLKTLK